MTDGELLARVSDALVELRQLRSHDEAAAEAMHAVRLTAHTLEALWLPALRQLAELRK